MAGASGATGECCSYRRPLAVVRCRLPGVLGFSHNRRYRPLSLRDTLDNISSSPVPPNEQEVITEILLVVQGLGWDPLNDVKQEYPVSGGRIDIALLGPERVVAFIEAKAPRVTLGSHILQVVKYAFHQGVDICVLTNGLEWWLYLPREPVPFEERRFATLKIREDPTVRLAERLDAFLSKHNLVSGRALRAARQALECTRSDQRLGRVIPETWSAMLADPDDELVELVRERVHKKEGLRPTKEQVVDAIRGSPSPSIPTPDPRKPSRPPSTPKGHIRFRLWAETYTVNSWIRVLLTVLAQLHRRHGDTQFALQLGRLVSRDPDHFSRPVQVGAAGFFINRSIPVTEIQRRSYASLKRFGYASSDLEVLSN